MICDNCDHDSPRYHVRLVVFFHAGWPPIECSSLCKRCRRELGIGAGNRLLVGAMGLVALGAVAAAGFGIVCLVQWILNRGSAS